MSVLRARGMVEIRIRTFLEMSFEDSRAAALAPAFFVFSSV